MWCYNEVLSRVLNKTFVKTIVYFFARLSIDIKVTMSNANSRKFLLFLKLLILYLFVSLSKSSGRFIVAIRVEERLHQFDKLMFFDSQTL